MAAALRGEVVDCLHVAWEAGEPYPWPDRARMQENRTCTDCGHTWTVSVVRTPTPAQDEIDADETPDAPRMPEFGPPFPGPPTIHSGMNAIAYAAGGRLFELLVHQDASVLAEDGVLKVTHLGPIHGIVMVRPVHAPNPAGEEQSDVPDDEDRQ